MKRNIVIPTLLSVSILAAWVIFQAFASSPPKIKSDKSAINVQDEAAGMLEADLSEDLAFPETGTDVKIAPVFDVTGAVVSDPTGTLLSVVHVGNNAIPVAGAEVKIAPVFNTSGAIVSDPTGTILSAVHTGNMAIPLTGAEVKIAPVFDTTGAVVSDPTGTLLSVVNP